MKRAYIADTLIDSQLVFDWLQGNGVPCEIFHGNAMGALGELPVTSPEVWVRRDADLSRAKRLITKMEFGNDGKSVLCQRCGETNPAGFDICWQCQLQLR
ncbi:MAG: DUF2007 domain-containing protein [Gammaproteobacteria bacterium]